MTARPTLEVIRRPASFTFDPATLSPVYLDTIRLLHGDTVLYHGHCQSVAIHPRCTMRESLATGRFRVRIFQARRLYANPVHEIIDAMDLEGEAIDERAMQMDAESGLQGRYLIHDDYNAASGTAYRAPWSAACIMLPYIHYREFNAALRAVGLLPGDIIEAELREMEA